MKLSNEMKSFLKENLEARASVFIYGKSLEQRRSILEELILLLPNPEEADETYVFIAQDEELNIPNGPLWVRRKVTQDNYPSVINSAMRTDASLISIVEMPENGWSAVWAMFEMGNQGLVTVPSPNASLDAIENLTKFAESIPMPISAFDYSLNKQAFLILDLAKEASLSRLVLKDGLKLSLINLVK